MTSCTLRQSLAKVFGRAKVTLGQAAIDQVRGEPELAPKTIATIWILTSRNIQPAPQHTVLSGEDRKICQRMKLIAACTDPCCKASCNLVSPFLLIPPVAGRIGKGFELGRGAAHVGRTAECYCVGGINSLQQLFVLKTARDDVITGNSAKGYIRERGRAALKCLRQLLGSSGYGKVDDRELSHCSSPLQKVLHLRRHRRLAQAHSRVT